MTASYNGEPVLGKNPSIVGISNSEIQTFKECKRKWWLTYYRGLQMKLERPSGPLALGTRVHAALEAYYADNQDPVEVYRQLAEADRYNLLVEQRPTDDFDKEAELGRVMIEGYVEWLEETGADENLEVVGAEKRLSATLLDGKVELQGKLDLRVKRKTDGIRLLFDHKTVGTSFAEFNKTAHMAEQVLVYMILEALQPDELERCDGAVYNLLRKTKRSATAKPPFYERTEVRHNKTTLDAFWKRLHGMLGDIVHLRAQLDAGADHFTVAYPTPTKDCSWKCPFYAVCPMFDDGSAAEQMLSDYYKQVDPYQRYLEVPK